MTIRMINDKGAKMDVPENYVENAKKNGFKPFDNQTQKEEKGFWSSLGDEANMIDATLGRSINDFTNLPANLLQMGYAGFKKGIDSLGNNAELGANPELGISADDISRMQQSDPSYNPFDKENTLGQLARIPNTAFNKTADGIGSLTGMGDNKYYNDDRAYEENLENANPFKKAAHKAIDYGVLGGITKAPIKAAAKFGAGSSIYEQGLEKIGFKNPIVADLLTAVKNPLDAARSSAKMLKNPKEKILYPLGNKVFLGKKFNVDKAEIGKELLGDNNYAANMFTEGSNRPTDYYLRNLGGENYLQKQKNADLELQNIINKIGENIGLNSNEKLLQQQIQDLYSSAREGVQGTLTTPKNVKEYIQNQNTTTFKPTTKAEQPSDSMIEAKKLIDNLHNYSDDRLIEVEKLINEFIARNEDLGAYYDKNSNLLKKKDIQYKILKGTKNAIAQDIKEAGEGTKWFGDLEKGKELIAKGYNRDKHDKHYHSTVDYSTGDTRLSNLSKKLNDPEQRKRGDSLIANELDQQKIDKLAELTQFITKNKKAADINPSGTTAANKKWFSTLSALGTLISIPQAIATHSALPLSGLSPFAIKKLGEASGNLMSDPKFLDYAIKVAKSPKNKQAQLSLDAMIQKKTGLTTRQLSTILARDSVNKLTIDKNEESGK